MCRHRAGNNCHESSVLVSTGESKSMRLCEPRMAEVQFIAVHVTLNLQQPDPIVELSLDSVVLVCRDCRIAQAWISGLAREGGMLGAKLTTSARDSVRVVRANDRHVRVLAITELGVAIAGSLREYRRDEPARDETNNQYEAFRPPRPD